MYSRDSIGLRARLDVASEAAMAAGRAIRSGGPVAPDAIEHKPHDGVVSHLDVLANGVIHRVLREAYPNEPILSEEEGQDLAAVDWQGPLWIVDPLDGSSNAISGHPHVGVSVAFARAGTVLAGAVFAPYFDELFVAARGHGAWLGSTPLKVSSESDLRRSLVSTGLPHDRRHLESSMKRVELIAAHALDIRRSGSPTLDICWVAAGRLAAHSESLQPWDIAAADLIAREAGAVRASPPVASSLPADLDGDRYFIACPGVAHELFSLLYKTDLRPACPATAQGSM